MDWSILAEMTSDAVAVFRSGQRVTIGTALLDCIEGTLRSSWAAEAWGRDNTYRLSLTVRRADLTTLPAVRSTVTYRGTTYRIIERAENNLAGSVQLHLGDA